MTVLYLAVCDVVLCTAVLCSTCVPAALNLRFQLDFQDGVHGVSIWVNLAQVYEGYICPFARALAWLKCSKCTSDAPSRQPPIASGVALQRGPPLHWISHAAVLMFPLDQRSMSHSPGACRLLYGYWYCR